MSMRITPIDIQQVQFRTRPFGYDKAGVDQFLEQVAEELERQHRQVLDLQEQLARARTQIAEQREREETLRETLITTQRVTDELKATARREVDVMLAEAELKAERLMRNAEERRQQLIEEIQEIKRQKVDFEVGLRGLLEKHIRMLDLHTPAVEHTGREARLLEEPLPFPARDKAGTKPTAADAGRTTGPAPAEVRPVVPAEEPSAAPELAFDFDIDEDGGEEDVLK